MPRFPRPFFKRTHGAYYVQLYGRQVRLAVDRKGVVRSVPRFPGTSFAPGEARDGWPIVRPDRRDGVCMNKIYRYVSPKV